MLPCLAMNQDFEVIVTLSPKTLTPPYIKGFLSRGASIFRINGSHVTIPQAKRMIHRIRALSHHHGKILIDLPGTKVRFRNFPKPLPVRKDVLFRLKEENFNYPELLQLIKPEHLLFASDGTLPFQLVKKKGGDYYFKPSVNGILQNGKGINIRGEHPPIPFLHELDYQLIHLAQQEDVDLLGFSYIRSPEDVIQANDAVKKGKPKAIIKIETHEACKQLKKIIPLTDTILIDRGDLASEIGIHHIPDQIKRIIREGRKHDKKIFLATQFLYYMVKHPIPSLSEIVALHETLKIADGLQLSEETAIGDFPLNVLDVIQEGLKTVRDSRK